MAELSTCCSPAAQETCCDPSDKAACCGEESCGCAAAGKVADTPCP
jgi:arsenite methyltransferase